MREQHVLPPQQQQPCCATPKRSAAFVATKNRAGEPQCAGSRKSKGSRRECGTGIWLAGMQ